VILTKDSNSSVTDIGGKVKKAFDKVISDRDGVSKWKPFRDFLIAEFTKAAQEGRLNTVDQYVVLLSEVRDGLVAQSATQAEEFNIGGILVLVQLVLSVIQDGEDITLPRILQIVMEVLKIFQGGGMEFSDIAEHPNNAVQKIIVEKVIEADPIGDDAFLLPSGKQWCYAGFKPTKANFSLSLGS